MYDQGIKVFANGGEAAESSGRWPRDHVGSCVKRELGGEVFCESYRALKENRGNACLHSCTFLHCFVCVQWTGVGPIPVKDSAPVPISPS